MPEKAMENAWIEIEMGYSEDRSGGDYRSVEYRPAGTQNDPGITEAQVRQAAEVFQKNLAAHRKSFDEFITRLNGDSLMNVYGCSLYIRYGGKRDETTGKLRDYDSMRQYGYLTVEEIHELEDELGQLGFLVIKEDGKDDIIYSDIADAYYY